LGRVDHERPFPERDAGEAAGDNHRFFAVEDVGAEVDVARFDAGAADEAA
jgi:hypothetical protein